MLSKVELLFYMLLSVFFYSKVYGELCTQCDYKTVHRMLAADCYHKDIREIPQCLRTKVEVLELSYNRIRTIKDGDLSRYSNVKILYLSDNMISNIDESALSSLTSLISLDLTLNVLDTVPLVIFHLPSLKKLYLSQNGNINIAEVVNMTKSITSPLEHIDISYNKFQELPEFGILPTLVTYNISGNNVRKFSLRNIAGLCNLKILINNHFSAEYEDVCDCWELTKWMQLKGIQFTPLNCPVAEDACTYNFSEREILDYEECKIRFEKIVLEKKLITYVAPAVAVFLVALLIILFILFRRRKRKLLRREKKYGNILPSKSDVENETFTD
ncbi:leucine-rich repeat and immunoglobulin-like domain-containing nogo receptor-interacting protein 2 [Agrilus planipennis]|uniref:Leucine-rich repeat and immunoglobulin-like domain-containing nogo receptor-interacting protein 2 n=1 Tax=Agrilus planipennis TaxID=224129 RepID=A0A7F5R8Q9_AGRPL|nr:leucine-rich repeat and immunoglobulin-like domain-containing nogo receptor-interacting protein 2 [Agrilus planipennis]